MSNSDDIFNYAIGALACISAAVSVFLYYRSYLPSAQIKVLDELLEETKTIYNKAESEGWLPPGPLRATISSNLTSLELDSNDLREQTYKAITVPEEFVASLKGLSRDITKKIRQVKKFRAYLMTASQEQRQLQRANRVSSDGQHQADRIRVSDGSSALSTLQSERHLQNNTSNISPLPTVANFTLDDRALSSRSLTIAEEPEPFSVRWWSFRIPFSRLKWCLEYSQSKPSVVPNTEPNPPDIMSLPV